MNKWSSLVAVTLFLASCTPKQEWQRNAITDKEKAVMDVAKKGKVDTAGIQQLITAYDAYVAAYPQDTTGANYLFKEADFYRYMHKPEKSVEIYSNIYNHYPDYFKRPYALFLQGFIYENEIRNLDSARAKYQQFIDVYPTHPIAKDVKVTLEQLGKTPEQIIAEFEARQKSDSAAAATK